MVLGVVVLVEVGGATKMATPISSKLKWESMNPILAGVLNPVLANPTNNIQILENVTLRLGVNIINHKLGTMMNGWFIADIQGSSVIFRSAPFNSLTLVLTASAPVTCNIGVF